MALFVALHGGIGVATEHQYAADKNGKHHFDWTSGRVTVFVDEHLCDMAGCSKV